MSLFLFCCLETVPLFGDSAQARSVERGRHRPSAKQRIWRGPTRMTFETRGGWSLLSAAGIDTETAWCLQGPKIGGQSFCQPRCLLEGPESRLCPPSPQCATQAWGGQVVSGRCCPWPWGSAWSPSTQCSQSLSCFQVPQTAGQMLIRSRAPCPRPWAPWPATMSWSHGRRQQQPSQSAACEA